MRLCLLCVWRWEIIECSKLSDRKCTKKLYKHTQRSGGRRVKCRDTSSRVWSEVNGGRVDDGMSKSVGDGQERRGNIMAVQHHHHHRHSSSTLSTRSCDWIENYFRGIIDCLTSKLCWVVTKAVATVTSWFKEFLIEKTRKRDVIIFHGEAFEMEFERLTGMATVKLKKY